MARILLIDDSFLTRRMTGKILSLLGYEVIEAEGGIEGLAKIDFTNPDAVLLDLLMPDLKGEEVLRNLQLRGVKVPVVVLTADIQESTRKMCMELGAVAFLNKPVTKDTIESVLNKIFSSSDKSV